MGASKIKLVRVGDVTTVRYLYHKDKELAFNFGLLSEVGQPYQPAFRGEIKRRGFVIQPQDYKHTVNSHEHGFSHLPNIKVEVESFGDVLLRLVPKGEGVYLE
jgi:hypothetical protein